MSMGPFGGGGYYGSYVNGPTGPWGGCGCSSFLMIIAGIILVFAGCFRSIGY
jgi:hypothetical protein